MPESALRDRTRRLVDLNATTGFETIFSRAEEEKLVSHISYMVDIGYGYNVFPLNTWQRTILTLEARRPRQRKHLVIIGFTVSSKNGRIFKL